jgi:uncharacterized protein
MRCNKGAAVKELVEEIVKALVTKPEDVVVHERDLAGDQGTALELRVAPEDLGRVIGKQGRTARSIRSVVTAAASKTNVRYTVDIAEPPRAAAPATETAAE